MKIAFELKRLTLPVDDIMPVRNVKDNERGSTRYFKIKSSIPEVGIIEPLMVYPQKGGKYLLLDGRLRLHALKELGIKEVECIVSTDDECFTFNARVSRLAPIQEHHMIMKAVKNGVSPERIATALHMDVTDVRSNMNLLKGIHAEAIDLLKDKQISPSAIRMLKRVTPVRQIEMAELMVSGNDFSKGYVDALFMGTPKDQLAVSGKAKKLPGLSQEDITRLEGEMDNLQRDFKAIEEEYAENMLNFTVIRTYIKKLLERPRVVKFLTSHHQDIFSEFEAIAATESI